MRYLVLSDIHSNIEALEACVGRADLAGYDQVLCCGDVVGYGPNPAEVMDVLADLKALCIRGNHDREVAGEDNPAQFNNAAREAVLWTRRNLSGAYRERLGNLHRGPLLISSDAQLVHGSARDEDEYVLTEGTATLNLALSPPAITFFGHTHEPVVFSQGSARWSPSYVDGAARLQLPDERILVNPGSVGQPRDGDSRASFLVWDTGKAELEFYRTEYPLTKTQDKMRAARLPDFLISRLAVGR